MPVNKKPSWHDRWFCRNVNVTKHRNGHTGIFNVVVILFHTVSTNGRFVVMRFRAVNRNTVKHTVVTRSVRPNATSDRCRDRITSYSLSRTDRMATLHQTPPILLRYTCRPPATTWLRFPTRIRSTRCTCNCRCLRRSRTPDVAWSFRRPNDATANRWTDR